MTKILNSVFARYEWSYDAPLSLVKDSKGRVHEVGYIELKHDPLGYQRNFCLIKPDDYKFTMPFIMTIMRADFYKCEIKYRVIMQKQHPILGDIYLGDVVDFYEGQLK